MAFASAERDPSGYEPSGFISPLSNATQPIRNNSNNTEESPPPRGSATKPPPPLTTRMLNMMESANKESKQHIPPSSPADSVTQAMKRDLEDLIAHIDGFVLESKTKTTSPKASTQFLFHDKKDPSIQEQSFHHSHRKPLQNQAIFRDRTNAEQASPAASTVKPSRPDPVETARASPIVHESSYSVCDPAGSPPPGESSMYFHDESLSMILSQSSFDIEEANLPANAQDKYSTLKASPSPRLMTRFRQEGILPPTGQQQQPEATPARSKTKSISFRKVSRDATPAKSLDYSNTEVFSPSAMSFPNLASFSQDMAKDSPHVVEDRNEHSWLNTNPAEVTAGSKSWSLIRDATPHPSRFQHNAITEGDDGDFSVVRNLNEVTNPSDSDPTVDQTATPKALSPENAKKLLQTAIDTLKDARYERENSRKWAQEIKESVEQWVDEQRELIRTESASVAATSAAALSTASTAQVQKLESSIHKLQNEISRSNTMRSDQESKLEQLLLRQEAQISSLTSELSAVKTHLSQVLHKDDGVLGRYSQRGSTTPLMKSTNPPRYPATPKSLSSSRWSEASVASSHTNRSRTRTPNGGHLIKYGNGITKEIHPDGTTVTRFVNGDVETRFGDIATHKNGSASKAIVAYFHNEEGVLQISQKDGSILYEYSNGQMERHYTDGSKVVMFPDGTKKIVKVD
ncbi:MAG: hypothetical protein SGILL_001667, partial [Bacillariaceae sp.]